MSPDPSFSRRYACLPAPEYHDGDFSISTVQDTHIEPIRQWRNAQMDVLRQAREISPDGQRDYFDRCIWPTLANPQPANILVTFFERGQPIGYGGLVHIHWEDGRGEVSFLLAPQLASDAEGYDRRFSAFLGLIKQLAFDALGLGRLLTETYAFRDRHIATLEGCGFMREGRMRNHVRINGKAIDSLIHGCLKHD